MPYATNSILLGNGVAANRKDVNVYIQIFYLFRKLPIASRFDSCSLPIRIDGKNYLCCFKKNRPIVAPVAPTSASRRKDLVNCIRTQKMMKAQSKLEALRLGLHLFQLTKENIPK